MKTKTIINIYKFKIRFIYTQTVQFQTLQSMNFKMTLTDLDSSYNFCSFEFIWFDPTIPWDVISTCDSRPFISIYAAMAYTWNGGIQWPFTPPF